MRLSRPPKAALTPFIDLLWVSDGEAVANPSRTIKELVLPTGATHLVFRLGETPLKIYSAPEDITGQTVGTSVIGGPRARPYIKDITTPEPTVGVLLRPGAAELIFGVPANELAGKHTKIEDIWSPTQLGEIRSRLLETPRLEQRLAVIEDVLMARLPRMRGLNPLIIHALDNFRLSVPVGEVARQSGYSHRYFSRIFTEAVGLSPKKYCRVLRFGRILDRIQREPGIGWGDLAYAEGYADQAHMTREFREFAALSPGDYRKAVPSAPRHVPLSQ